jgi:hypothetical protein
MHTVELKPVNLEKTVSRKKAQKAQRNTWGYTIVTTNQTGARVIHYNSLFL